MTGINFLASRLLTYGVVLLPFQQYPIFRMYEHYRVPDDILDKYKKDELEKYVKGLYLSGQESAGDWKRGNDILKELGFIEERREEGHRTFVTLKFREHYETCK